MQPPTPSSQGKTARESKALGQSINTRRPRPLTPTDAQPTKRSKARRQAYRTGQGMGRR
jgi:hypothetical protein